VHKAFFAVVDFWLDLGVDGMRLDAVPICTNAGHELREPPRDAPFLKQLRAHVDSKYEGRMLLAGANQWRRTRSRISEGRRVPHVLPLPIMPRLFMALRLEDRHRSSISWSRRRRSGPLPVGDFLRNHDELTLEMVTDEERDYMYRAYAHDPQMRINLGSAAGSRRSCATIAGRSS